MLQQVSRRAFLATIGAAAACAPAATPGPDSPGSAAKAAWEQEWDTLVAAAKKEGKVVVHAPVGAGFREALDEFMKAFPGIELDLQQYPEAATYGQKIRQERAAAIYSLDAAILPVAGVFQELKPHGVLDPLRPFLFRPDVMDDKAWDGGFEFQWMDTEKQFTFRMRRDVSHQLWINTDLVKEGEIKTIDDLLDPKWKGRISIADPRQGAMYLPMTALKLNGREDAIRKFIVDQQPAIIRDRRQAPEALIRGRYAIAVGILPQVVQEYVAQGVGKNAKNIELPEMDFQPSDTVHVYNKAPHPNAAKLFVNWMLTKEAQTAYCNALKFNSSRLDVPVVEPFNVPRPGFVYKVRNQEEVQPAIVEVQQLLLDLTKGM